MGFEEFAMPRLRGWLGLATALSGDSALAEDLVQEVLIKVVKKWDHIRGLDVPDAYVRRMVVNQFVSWQRKWGRLVPQASLEDLLDEYPDHAVAHSERDALARDLARLPRRQQAVLTLRYWSGLSDPQIAELLGCAASTVRSTASRALATLRIEAATEITTGGTKP